MFARITPFKMKPGSKDEAVKIMDRVRSDIMGLPGMQHFINVMDDDGKGYVIALTDQAEVSADLQRKISAIWTNFTDFLENAPNPESYEVMADWEN